MFRRAARQRQQWVTELPWIKTPPIKQASVWRVLLSTLVWGEVGGLGLSREPGRGESLERGSRWEIRPLLARQMFSSPMNFPGVRVWWRWVSETSRVVCYDPWCNHGAWGPRKVGHFQRLLQVADFQPSRGYNQSWRETQERNDPNCPWTAAAQRENLP